MIVYEVRIVLDPAIADEYRAWLEAHIREILAIPGFSGAELLAEQLRGQRLQTWPAGPRG